jgi:hypothetical protein
MRRIKIMEEYTMNVYIYFKSDQKNSHAHKFPDIDIITIEDGFLKLYSMFSINKNYTRKIAAMFNVDNVSAVEFEYYDDLEEKGE